MCGICGIATASGAHAPPQWLIERMSASIAHRGPDDHAVFLSPGVALGHRRLSIVDLAGGRQPMPNEDRSAWIAFNGEIYNHADLRHQLQAQGHTYHTASDTESILHLFEQEGPAGFAKLQGMFAFAIWDDRTRTLTLARDHSGIKPLYYAITPEGDLVFGSEVKALFAGGLLRPTLERSALPEFFATGHVSGARTLLAGVHKLPPGHWLRWQQGAHSLAPFWSLREAAGSQVSAVSPLPLAEAGGEFWRRFVGAVESQLMSDVPLGAFLSGGLDSSLMVAAMVELGVQDIQTFSVGYADREANELPYAREVASIFRTRHHEVLLTPQAFLNALPHLTWHRDFPLTFPASVPLAAVAEAAVSNVKVVLTGEGADELFAGYGRYPRALVNLRWGGRLDRWLPGPVRRALQAGFSRLGDGFIGSRVRRSFLAQHGTVAGAYLEPFSEFGREERRRLFGDDQDAFRSRMGMIDQTLLDRNPLEALLRLDQETYLEELLMKQDTMSMAASLESRVPFLDHTLRIWAAGLPARLKLDGWVGKAVVRSAAGSHLPAAITEASKRGFPVPLARWFRLPEGRDLLETCSRRGWEDAGLQPKYVRQLVSEHLAGHDRSAQLWRILAFGIWLSDTLPRLSADSEVGPLQAQILT